MALSSIVPPYRTSVTSSRPAYRDTYDNTVLYGAHHSFVKKWLESFNASSKVATVDPGTNTVSPTAAEALTAATDAQKPALSEEPPAPAPPVGLDPAATAPNATVPAAGPPTT